MIFTALLALTLLQAAPREQPQVVPPEVQKELDKPVKPPVKQAAKTVQIFKREGKYVMFLQGSFLSLRKGMIFRFTGETALYKVMSNYPLVNPDGNVTIEITEVKDLVKELK